MSAKTGQTLNPAVFSVGNHYGFNGFPTGDWRSTTNLTLLSKVFQFRALADEDFDLFCRTELKTKADLLRSMPGWHQSDFTDFYELFREVTLGFSFAWFTKLLEIAKGNRNLLSEDPIWWAHAQVHAILCQELAVPQRSTGFPFWRIRKWVQYFCDGDWPADAIDAADLGTAVGFFRFAARSDWQAPKWLWAWARKYYGRDEAPWKNLKSESDSMERLGEQETEKLLTTITSHFWEHVDHRLSEHAARVSVDDAKTGISIPDAAKGADTAIEKENRAIAGESGIVAAVSSKTVKGAAKEFFRSGDTWTVSVVEGESVQLQHLVGLDYLWVYVKHAGHPLTAAQVQAMCNEPLPPIAAAPVRDFVAELSDIEEFDVRSSGPRGDISDALTDDKTLNNLRKRAYEIQHEVSTARRLGQELEIQRLERELEKITEYILSTTERRDGHGPRRPRQFPNAAEKSRQRISQAIKRVLEKLKKHGCPKTRAYFETALTLGQIGCFRDDTSEWQLDRSQTRS